MSFLGCGQACVSLQLEEAVLLQQGQARASLVVSLGTATFTLSSLAQQKKLQKKQCRKQRKMRWKKNRRMRSGQLQQLQLR